MKMLTIKNNIVGNGFKPFQIGNHNDGILIVENDNVGNADIGNVGNRHACSLQIRQYQYLPIIIGSYKSAVSKMLTIKNNIVGNGLKSFQIGNHNDGILIVENDNVGNADLRSLREKLKTITNQIVIWAKQKKLCFWK